MKDKDQKLIEHIIRHCDEIADTVKRFECSGDKFKGDHVFYNACSMSIFQICELSKKISDEFKSSHAELPWREMRGMRNLFAREYESLNKNYLWETIQNDIPPLRTQLLEICQEEGMHREERSGIEQ